MSQKIMTSTDMFHEGKYLVTFSCGNWDGQFGNFELFTTHSEEQAHKAFMHSLRLTYGSHQNIRITGISRVYE